MSFTTRAMRPVAAVDGRQLPSVAFARAVASWQLGSCSWHLGRSYVEHAEAVPV
jgi:hypothetical protein